MKKELQLSAILSLPSTIAQCIQRRYSKQNSKQKEDDNEVRWLTIICEISPRQDVGNGCRDSDLSMSTDERVVGAFRGSYIEAHEILVSPLFEYQTLIFCMQDRWNCHK